MSKYTQIGVGVAIGGVGVLWLPAGSEFVGALVIILGGVIIVGAGIMGR